MQLSRLGLFNVNGRAGCLEQNSGKRGGFRVVSCQIHVMRRKNFPKKFGSSEKMLTFALAKQK